VFVLFNLRNVYLNLFYFFIFLYYFEFFVIIVIEKGIVSIIEFDTNKSLMHRKKDQKISNVEKEYILNEFLFFISSLILSIVIFFIGRLFGNTGTFIAVLIILIFIGRQTGNRLSKLLIFQKTIVMILIGLIWGGVTALLLRLLLLWTHPGIISIVIGYGAGLYTSIINYDVFMRDSRLSELFSDRLEENQEIMNFASIISFIILSVFFIFY